MADQGLLNGRLLQSAAMDCTVHCSRLYGPLQRTIQSAAGDCSNPTDRQAYSKGRKRLVRLVHNCLLLFRYNTDIIYKGK